MLRCMYRVEYEDARGRMGFKRPVCRRVAEWISCQPFVDTRTCTEHKCRCAKPLSPGRKAEE